MSVIRASDDDRQATAESLRTHFAAGRLDVEDFERRLAAVVAAETLGELAEATRDLPGAAPAAPAPPRPPAPPHDLRLGNRQFRQEHDLPVAVPVAWQQVMTHIAPDMTVYGYSIVEKHPPELLVFELREEETRVAVSLRATGPHTTKLVVSGTARRPVRAAFAELSSE